MYDSSIYFRDAFHAAASGMDAQTSFFRTMSQITGWVAPGLSKSYDMLAQASSTAATLSHRFGRANTKPSFNIGSTVIDGQNFRVTEEAIAGGPFGVLKHFKREPSEAQAPINLGQQPKLLLVAPMSGHHATIFRETVRNLLPDHDIYVTDWTDARMVPINAGKFDLDDQIDYVQSFIETIGPNTHVLGYSQSTVPVLSAVSLLAAKQSPAQPLSMILVAGPIDPTISETGVGKLARDHSMNEFEGLISQVPLEHAGAGRPVYSGRTQLMALSCADPAKRLQVYNSLLQHTYLGHTVEAAKLTAECDEYESTFDIPREHWLDMIRYFKTNPIGNGTMKHRGVPVNPGAITKTAILTLEGDHDKIVGLGQTSIVHKLAGNLPLSMKFHHICNGADHYTVMDPNLVANFVYKAEGKKVILFDSPSVTKTPHDADRKPPAVTPALPDYFGHDLH
ncbi:MAG: intracellular depolymerase [Micavibrio sp.]|nr:intracellular depolymerase [Micavibrio sp.]